MYVYIRTEPNVYTVGFYDPTGKWNPESDFNSTKEAAERVAYLNGSIAIKKALDGDLNSSDRFYRL